MKFVNLGKIQWTVSPERKPCNGKVNLSLIMLFYLILYFPTWISLLCHSARWVWRWKGIRVWTQCQWLLMNFTFKVNWIKYVIALGNIDQKKRKILNFRRGLVIQKPTGCFLLILCMTFLVAKSIPFLSERLNAQLQGLQFVNSDTFSENRAMGLRLLRAGKT